VTPHRINFELCRALGIDPDGVSRVVLVLSTGHLPVARVTRMMMPRNGEAVVSMVRRMSLRPQNEGMTDEH